jgi:hypothetical protein
MRRIGRANTRNNAAAPQIGSGVTMIGMSASVSVDEARRLILISLEGAVGDRDLQDLSRAVRNEPALAAGFPVLYDCRGVTDLAVSGELIRGLALQAQKDQNRVAFLVSAPAVFGLARMYEIASRAEGRIRIFSSESPAIEWLLASPPPSL